MCTVGSCSALRRLEVPADAGTQMKQGDIVLSGAASSQEAGATARGAQKAEIMEKWSGDGQEQGATVPNVFWSLPPTGTLGQPLHFSTDVRQVPASAR